MAMGVTTTKSTAVRDYQLELCFELKMKPSNLLNFTRFLSIVYSYQVSTLSDLNKKNLKPTRITNQTDIPRKQVQQ